MKSCFSTFLLLCVSSPISTQRDLVSASAFTPDDTQPPHSVLSLQGGLSEARVLKFNTKSVKRVQVILYRLRYRNKSTKWDEWLTEVSSSLQLFYF